MLASTAVISATTSPATPPEADEDTAAAGIG
jgi:hypothetical protein